MKNIFTLFIVTIFTTISFSQERNFNISITVKGMENQIGILANYYADKRMIKDTLKFDINGIATIKGKKKHSCWCVFSSVSKFPLQFV